MAKRQEKVTILGAGPAGLTAAIYAGRADLNPLVIEGLAPGGQPTLTTTIENYPGFPEGIQGPELARRLRQQAAKFGARFIGGEVTKTDLRQRPFRIFLGEKEILTQAAIIASGGSPRFLGLPREKELLGRGVSTCATCDAFFYRQRTTAIVGGGDTAMVDALVLAKVARQVYIIHRRDQLRASPANQRLIRRQKNIKILWNKIVVGLEGKEKLAAVNLQDTETGKQQKLALDGLFLAVGHSPNSKFLRGQIKLDRQGYVAVRRGVFTSVEGVFAAGDVADPVYQQLASAVGSGCSAAMEAAAYLRQRE